MALENAKIKSTQFKSAVDSILNDTILCKSISNMRIETDENGNLTDHFAASIKSVLYGAIQMSTDMVLRRKAEKMLDFLNSY